MIILQGAMPLARAVTTYGLLSSSSRLLRMILIRLAVPEVPSTTAGTHKCCNTSRAFPILQGASWYSVEIRPPTLWPK